MADNPPPDQNPAPRKLRPCPICGKPEAAATKPFCSARCADVDLHRWLGGVYAIPGAANTDEEDSILPGGEAQE